VVLTIGFEGMDRLVFLERLVRLAEFSRAGLRAVFRELPKHWDKRGITARAVASSFTPGEMLIGDPKGGLAIGGGLRALREPYQAGMKKSKRRLQLVTPDGTTIATITRPRKKVWSVESLVNTERTSSVPTTKLAKSYKSLMGFKDDRKAINKTIRDYQVGRDVPLDEFADKTGGIPLVRPPAKRKP
jgi:hypothetical protein